ncbi:MAG TPA: PPK2 family polyphosphate kinase [Chitinophagaceae bacterium]|jgi:PPK2 family polyphosphate:nucleotide phosphotransferase|nr:PPK2 family polyphosphate kinase [Chitinophagaceae bacterium]
MEPLEQISTRAPEGVNKAQVKEQTARLLEELDALQNLLYAEGRHALLVVLQGLDASGKDGLIRKVFGSMNPLGIQVHSFKVPTAEEQAHDFLWRVHARVPARGMVQVFNRSHYEDVLVTRVNSWCDDATAHRRFAAINAFEALLEEEGNTRILKFYLHISPEEQRLRLQERLEDPTKHWKHHPGDWKVAEQWPAYRRMYADVFTHCNRVPWTVVPADQNWYKEYLVARAVVDTLKGLDMKYPGLPQEP